MRLWNQPCFYCGDRIEGIGIDRVDNTLGYVNGNLTPCCTFCNTLKAHFPQNTFLLQCQKISAHHDDIIS